MHRRASHPCGRGPGVPDGRRRGCGDGPAPAIAAAARAPRRARQRTRGAGRRVPPRLGAFGAGGARVAAGGRAGAAGLPGGRGAPRRLPGRAAGGRGGGWIAVPRRRFKQRKGRGASCDGGAHLRRDLADGRLPGKRDRLRGGRRIRAQRAPRHGHRRRRGRRAVLAGAGARALGRAWTGNRARRGARRLAGAGGGAHRRVAERGMAGAARPGDLVALRPRRGARADAGAARPTRHAGGDRGAVGPVQSLPCPSRSRASSPPDLSRPGRCGEPTRRAIQRTPSSPRRPICCSPPACCWRGSGPERLPSALTPTFRASR